MYIRVSKRENPFVQIDKAFIGNGKLSLKATGLLTYFLSKPDNWEIRLKDVYKRFKDKETSVRSGLEELMEAGYVYRYRLRNPDGTFGPYVYEIYERPEYNPHFSPKLENQDQDQPKLDFPEQDNPEQENHVYNNNDLNNNELNNKKEEEEKLKHLLNLIDRHITKVNEIIADSMAKWINRLNYDVIKEEILYCVKKGKSYVYLENMLVQDVEYGIDSVEALIEKRKSYSSSKQPQAHKNENRGQNKTYKKVVRKEATPDWLDGWYNELQEGYNENHAPDADDMERKRKELEKRLKNYK